MYLGKVVGTVVSTSKQDSLIGMKFLLVKRLNERLEEQGNVEIAVDSVGAGTGETVIVCKGSAARLVFQGNIPVDTVITGIVDTVEVS